MNNVRTEPPPTYNTQPYTPPTRPALRYHGSKWQLAGWIISYLPLSHVAEQYVTNYAGISVGGASSAGVSGSRAPVRTRTPRSSSSSPSPTPITIP